MKQNAFLAVFMVFACLLLASNAQRWVRDVQKSSPLNQFRPKMSKLKSAGSALNIAENEKIAESALKMTEYLWELNPRKFGKNSKFSRERIIEMTHIWFFWCQTFWFLREHNTMQMKNNLKNAMGWSCSVSKVWTVEMVEIESV